MKDKKVLACIDGSDLTETVCDYAAWIAQKVQLPIKLLHTINHHHETAVSADLSGNIGLKSQEHLLEELTNIEQQESKVKIQQGKEILQLAKDRVLQQGVDDFTCVQRHGDLVDAVKDLEKETGILVLGVRGQVHNKEHEIGSKLLAVIRGLHCPMLIINETFSQPKSIMIAYDGSPASEKALDMVASNQLYKGLTCHLVCVNESGAASVKLLEQAMKKLQGVDQNEIVTGKLKGKVDLELCAYQEQFDIDLTIMGAFSHSSLRDMVFGSLTHKMLLNSKKSLLLLR